MAYISELDLWFGIGVYIYVRLECATATDGDGWLIAAVFYVYDMNGACLFIIYIMCGG